QGTAVREETLKEVNATRSASVTPGRHPPPDSSSISVPQVTAAPPSAAMQTPIPAIVHTIGSLLAVCASGTTPWQRPDEFPQTADRGTFPASRHPQAPRQHPRRSE